MSTELRPGVTRFQPPDWFTNSYSISTNAERQQKASHQTRQEGRFLRNETNSQTKWDQYSNNVRLADRIDEIRKWKEILDKTFADLDKEIGDLSEAKEQTELALEGMNIPTDCNVENLTFREGRHGIDVVNDHVQHQLNKENEVIAGIKKDLQQKIGESFEQLCLLQEARQQVAADLQDKNRALGIDVDQYNLTDSSAHISYKPDSLRVPKGSTTPQQWEDYSRYNKQRADAEMDASNRLREAIHHALQKAANDYDAQKTATEYDFRKRYHEQERALDELFWQKKKTEDEIAELENDIRGLKEAIRNKINPMKKVQTRLENRTYRPGVELCRDAPQYGMTDEVKQLEATTRALEEKLKQSQHALDGLQKNLHRINDDIAEKTNSMMLDQRCMDVRQKLNPYPPSDIDRNLTISGIQRSRASTLA